METGGTFAMSFKDGLHESGSRIFRHVAHSLGHAADFGKVLFSNVWRAISELELFSCFGYDVVHVVGEFVVGELSSNVFAK